MYLWQRGVVVEERGDDFAGVAASFHVGGERVQGAVSGVTGVDAGDADDAGGFFFDDDPPVSGA